MDMVCVYGHELFTESGKAFSIEAIPEFVEHADPSIFIVQDISWFLTFLDDHFDSNDDWQFKLSIVEKEIDALTIERVKLHSFGLRNTGRTGKRHKRLHMCWNPRSMSPVSVAKMLDDISPAGLLKWGTDIREWAREQNLELRNAFSGYASQLLRDERFYPEPRRKVPRATNERARPYLPGNFMSLYVQPGPTSHDVISIDQRSAHHRITQETPLPDSNTLFARGYFGDPEDADRFWCQPGSPLYDKTIRQPGLLYVQMASRPTVRGEYRLPIQNFQGSRRVWIWTNTIPFLQTTGSHIDGIYAAWTSTDRDTGLAKYGAWAQQQIESCNEFRKRWLKPCLHTAYGLLAARPRQMRIAYKRARGTVQNYLLGAREISASEIKMARPMHSPIANVLARGVIEAETQIRSLTMANRVTRAGCEVLHIHTDGMHVTGALPLIPQTWKIEALSRVTYIDNVSWIADGHECLPGRDVRERAEMVRHYGRLIASKRKKCNGRGSSSDMERETDKPTAT